MSQAANGRLSVHLGDVLDFNMENIIPAQLRQPWEGDSPNIHIVGNLPFNVSTPLIVRWMSAISSHSGPWQHGRVKLTLTFQVQTWMNELSFYRTYITPILGSLTQSQVVVGLLIRFKEPEPFGYWSQSGLQYVPQSYQWPAYLGRTDAWQMPWVVKWYLQRNDLGVARSTLVPVLKLVRGSIPTPSTSVAISLDKGLTVIYLVFSDRT